ncbi:DsbA family protein [Bradyrhizobium sp. Tv2a-2]|uniref:DsbA family protein n=1 Tax=Bradyrhizobium sp. Tv2a-2 TaxID=113395 RepID=UPI00040171D1|nr:DsbA family protein [Bradyrhizobium sp. Tv2a-2]
MLKSVRLAALSLLVLGAAFTSPPARADKAQTMTLLAKAPALPDMALGKDHAPITIIEYSSLTCPHCAAFEENVFPMLRSKYIDTGKVRFISREFPLELKAVAASMLARCIAANDAPRYFDAITMLFKQQDAVIEHTVETLKDVGAHFGMSEQDVDTCEKNQEQLDKIAADQKFAFDQLKVDATPTFFINGEISKGSMSFEELDKRLTRLLKR